ncbi:hypothetical protein BDD12DRAFT_802326 [Trichophaea hybrida]|nr:hypothetical protein BDD12DRAFT_802326 [Trichophaea hybrida]
MALIFQIFIYTCCRPGAFVESSSHSNSNEVMRYGDVELSILHTENGSVVHAELSFRYVKNHRDKDVSRGHMFGNKKPYGYGLCPVTLLALAFADNVFDGNMTPANFFALKESNRGTITCQRYPCLCEYPNVVFLIDEAQETYKHKDFWMGFIKARSGRFWGTKICLFSSYGSPANGPVDYLNNSAPIHLGVQRRVGITLSLVNRGPTHQERG